MAKRFLLLSFLVAFAIAINLLITYRHFNVILITIDTLRADYLSCYNPNAAPTPNIDQLARNSVLFKNAFSLIPITLPSHTVILSSHPPEELNLFNNGDIYYGNWPLLPDILADHKYRSAGFVSLPVLRSNFGLGYHFNHYEDHFDGYHGRNYKVASEMNALALLWIEQQKDTRFFAWIHYSDPHEPYVTVDAAPDVRININGSPYGNFCLGKKEIVSLKFPAAPGENTIEFVAISGQPDEKLGEQRYLENRSLIFTPTSNMELHYGPEWKDFILPSGIPARFFEKSGVFRIINNSKAPVDVTFQFSGGIKGRGIEGIRRSYGLEVQYVDRYIGELWKKLEDLKLTKKTILVFTADHGEGLKTHDNLSHVNCLYNEALHIPLIIYAPQMGYRGSQVDPMVNHLDIVPTILDLLHIHGTDLRGNSLKYYLTYSPIDRLLCKKPVLHRTFSSTYAPQAFLSAFSMIDGNTKLIDSPDRNTRPWQMYDLVQDPGELDDLLIADPKRADLPEMKALHKILENHRAQSEEARKKHHSVLPEESDREMLKALGYVEGTSENTQTNEDEQ